MKTALSNTAHVHVKVIEKRIPSLSLVVRVKFRRCMLETNTGLPLPLLTHTINPLKHIDVGTAHESSHNDTYNCKCASPS